MSTLKKFLQAEIENIAKTFDYDITQIGRKRVIIWGSKKDYPIFNNSICDISFEGDNVCVEYKKRKNVFTSDYMKVGFIATVMQYILDVWPYEYDTSVREEKLLKIHEDITRATMLIHVIQNEYLSKENKTDYNVVMECMKSVIDCDPEELKCTPYTYEG